MQTTTVSTICKAVAQDYGISITDIMSEQLAQSIARPRMVAMFLSVKLTCLSLMEIGEKFSRDHTTVIHARKSITAHYERDPLLRNRVARIMDALGYPDGLDGKARDDARLFDENRDLMSRVRADAKIAAASFEASIVALAEKNPRLVLDTLHKAFADLK